MNKPMFNTEPFISQQQFLMLFGVCVVLVVILALLKYKAPKVKKTSDMDIIPLSKGSALYKIRCNEKEYLVFSNERGNVLLDGTEIGNISSVPDNS